jgi:exoribonuclease-2
VIDSEGQMWVFQDNDDVNFVYVNKWIKNKVQIITDKGRDQRVSEDKLLWQYPSRLAQLEKWSSTVSAIEENIAVLQEEVDVPLLWETALELQLSDIKELSTLFFGKESSVEHWVAIWRALVEDRVHFKRRNSEWEPRSLKQVEELELQKERELARVQAQSLAEDFLKKAIKSPLPALFAGRTDSVSMQFMDIQEEILPFVQRMECWLRGDSDKDVEELVTSIAESVKLQPRELVLEILQKTGRMSLDADRDAIVAGLKSDFSKAQQESAQNIEYWIPAETESIISLFFSIDDEETREVDDALRIERDGEIWKITVAISDPARVVIRGDILDREAMRRGTTVYLPTQSVLMLPEKISCDIASLTAGQVRSAIVIRIDLDDSGHITGSQIARESVRVEQRLHYNDADILIKQGEGETANHLRNFLTVAQLLHNQRLENGALHLQRAEYKIHVTQGQVTVDLIERNSPSRFLVAEMMILANHMAAKYAQAHEVPVIYRTQESPLQAITEEMLADPLSFHKIRKLLKPSALSLHPAEHSSLGLSMYTQLSSPLRRFADLVMQRQLVAHLVGDTLPYNSEELFKVLATAEQTARDARRAEMDANRRWFGLYLLDNWQDKTLNVLVIDKLNSGYKVDIQPWGVDALLATTKNLTIGTIVKATIDTIRLKAMYFRLKLNTP